MKILETVEQVKEWREGVKNLGFVPTMGALHQGHLSLIKTSSSENESTLVSIFVNPTQFNNPEDLAKYPRTVEKDIELAKSAGALAVFLPSATTMYPSNSSCWVYETDLAERYCGKYRPGHFRGVLTVVMKLFQIVQPQRAYFGEKDFQQLSLIKKMVSEFFLPIEIRSLATLRESSGLAMSSRNQRLSEEGRRKASMIYRALSESKTLKQATDQIQSAGIEVEYLEAWGDERWLFAGYLEGVRLIDNVPKEIEQSKQIKQTVNHVKSPEEIL